MNMTKRLFDILVSLCSLVLFAPLFAAIGFWIKLDSPGPVFFRQKRVGLHGRFFKIHKFRTMIVDAEVRGPQLTIGADARITSSGDFLRKYKLDELPQILDVLLGDMSLVGPRPEVPKYVACYPTEIRDLVLSVRPGITDLASIEFRNENAMLSRTTNPEQEYIDKILPLKLNYCKKYVSEQSLWLDLRIIWKTISKVWFSK